MERAEKLDKAEERPPSLIFLFCSFLKLGLTAFGGPAMVAYIRRMAVTRRGWLDDTSFRDGVALCQAIPGATAMQTAAYVGLRIRGTKGAAASFVGFGLPAFLLMSILSALYTRTHSLPAVVSAFAGLRAVVVAIVANAALSFGRDTLQSWRDALISLLAAVLFGFRINPVLVIGLAALLGVSLLAPPIVPASSGQSVPRSSSTSPIFWVLVAITASFALLYPADRTLFDLAALMSRIDLFAFGGGFASLPLMFHEIVEVRSWLRGPTFLDGIVLGQVTPGPIVITATFVGYQVWGLLGGAIATVSVFLPSFLILGAVVPYFDRLRASSRFQSALRGSLCSFVGLLLVVTLRFAGNVDWSWPRLLLGLGALGALRAKVDLFWVIAGGTAISLLLPGG